MRVTINIVARANIESDLLSLEISPETTVGMLKVSVQAEIQIPVASQKIYHDGQLLSNESKTMEQLQIKDGEMLAIHVQDTSSSQQEDQQERNYSLQQNRNRDNAYPDSETIRLHLLGNPVARAQALNRRPELAEAIESPEKFLSLLRQINDQERLEQKQRQQRIAELNADPFNLEAQAKIEEIIREECVQENLQNALEHNPEVFGYVHMLYINVEVNGIEIKAFVDSGAQATIMSPSCAEKCGIMRLIDKRFAGVARGVGTAAIIGKVHSAQIKIGSLHLPCSFTVMEGKDVDLLLGLDMLKRHQACIDLSQDMLIIQRTKVPFLGEADIPKYKEIQRSQEPKLTGPGGLMIGTKSGVVSNPPAVLQPESSSEPAASSRMLKNKQKLFPPEDIERLEALGFSRKEVIQALEASDGQVEIAASLLFQG